MTDPRDATSNVQQELRELGWRPMEIIDERTGISFTRWFPPPKPDRNVDWNTNAGGDQR